MVIKDARVLCGDLNAIRATFFIQIAGRFRSNMWIEKDVYRVNAKGILDVLSLKVRQNDEVRIIADGIDDVEAVKKVAKFLTYSG